MKKLFSIILSLVIVTSTFTGLGVYAQAASDELVANTVKYESLCEAEGKEYHMFYKITDSTADIPWFMDAEQKTLDLIAEANEINKTNVTCASNYDVYFVCVNCFKFAVSTEPTPADHNYQTKTIDATCSKVGKMYQECVMCHDIINEETLPVVAHDFSDNAEYCKLNCGTKNPNYVTPHTHKFTNYVVTKEATCTSAGSKTGFCSCGAKETVSISKKAHSYNTVTTKARIGSAGSVKQICTVCNKVNSPTTIPAIKSVTLSATSYTYDGKVKNPAITITDTNGKKLVNKTDYTVTTPKGRKNIGKYTYKIDFKGKYSGSKDLTFYINPKGTSISSISRTTNTITVKYKKQSSVSGYQIQYATNKNFKNAKSATISKASTTSKKLTKLSAGTTYYVRVRVYKTVNKVKYYSAWSGYKTAKTSVPNSPTKPTNVTISASSTSITLKWNKAKYNTGYEIQYSTDSKYKNKKTVKITKASTTSKTITGLTKNKKYYVRIRAYHTVGKKTYNSDWISTSATTKKSYTYKTLVAGKMKLRDDGCYIVNEGVVWDDDYYSRTNKPCIIETDQKYLKKLYETYCNIKLNKSESDIESVIIISKFFYENIEYCHGHQHHYNPYNALTNGCTVCEGYATLFNDLCYLANVPCYYVCSKTKNHAWNIVKINGYWYNYDDTSSNNYLYLMEKNTVMHQGINGNMPYYTINSSYSFTNDNIYKFFNSGTLGTYSDMDAEFKSLYDKVVINNVGSKELCKNLVDSFNESYYKHYDETLINEMIKTW